MPSAAAGYAAGVRQFATSALGRVNASAGDAMQQAQAALYRVVQQQATTLAYTDAFYLLGFACIFSVALVFLMKPNKPGAGGQAADAAA